MTTFGIVLILAALVLLLLTPILQNIRKRQEAEGTLQGKGIGALSAFHALFSLRGILGVFLAGALLVLLPYLFFWAEPGYQYFVVFPIGSKKAVLSEGITWRGFAKITPWQKFIDVKVVEESEGRAEIEGPMRPIPVRFIDQVTATVKVSTRFQLPADEQSFLELAVEFRSLQNLVQTTLVPTVREVVSNTGYMFAAQDYISGSASDFRVAVDDQL